MMRLAMMAAALSAPATAPIRPCVTRSEVGDMTIMLAPFVIETARDRCRQHLGAGAFLIRPEGGSELATRLRADGGDRRASALRALEKMGDGPRPSGISDETLIQAMREGITADLLRNADPETCRNLDELFEGISAMSTAQIGRFATSLFSLAGVGRASGDRGPQICTQ